MKKFFGAERDEHGDYYTNLQLVVVQGKCLEKTKYKSPSTRHQFLKQRTVC
ncbi:hypothetical protein HispidOSU_022526 [Sigmodon hispidus]